jgi:hypothetical protein
MLRPVPTRQLHSSAGRSKTFEPNSPTPAFAKTSTNSSVRTRSPTTSTPPPSWSSTNCSDDSTSSSQTRRTSKPPPQGGLLARHAYATRPVSQLNPAVNAANALVANGAPLPTPFPIALRIHSRLSQTVQTSSYCDATNIQLTATFSRSRKDSNLRLQFRKP